MIHILTFYIFLLLKKDIALLNPKLESLLPVSFVIVGLALFLLIGEAFP